MKRREFITLLGCVVAVEPYVAGAQQVSKTAKVGLLYPGMAAALPSRVAGLRDGLQTAGYREPDNVEFLARAADGDPTRVAALAVELAERKVDVIVAVSPAAVQAAQAASTTIPIVALDLESDPITSGLPSATSWSSACGSCADAQNTQLSCWLAGLSLLSRFAARAGFVTLRQ